jgi:hypothetical protein
MRKIDSVAARIVEQFGLPKPPSRIRRGRPYEDRWVGSLLVERAYVGRSEGGAEGRGEVAVSRLRGRWLREPGRYHVGSST